VVLSLFMCDLSMFMPFLPHLLRESGESVVSTVVLWTCVFTHSTGSVL
jgi:hypothetical protein